MKNIFCDNNKGAIIIRKTKHQSSSILYSMQSSFFDRPNKDKKKWNQLLT